MSTPRGVTGLRITVNRPTTVTVNKNIDARTLYESLWFKNVAESFRHYSKNNTSIAQGTYLIHVMRVSRKATFRELRLLFIKEGIVFAGLAELLALLATGSEVIKKLDTHLSEKEETICSRFRY